MSKTLLTRATNLKLQYHKSSKLTPDVFNTLVDLIVSNLIIENTGETAISIRNKLQTLFGEDRLDITAIKNVSSSGPGSGGIGTAETAITIRNKLQSLVDLNRLDATAIKNIIAEQVSYTTSTSAVVSVQSIIDQILESTLLIVTNGDGLKFLNDQGQYISIDWSVITNKPTQTSDFTNDGDGTSPFITQEELDDALSISTSDKNYLHDQGVPSNTWVITHNMNKYPTVVVIDSAGTVVEGSIQYSSTDPLNELTVTFNGSFSGKASLN